MCYFSLKNIIKKVVSSSFSIICSCIVLYSMSTNQPIYVMQKLYDIYIKRIKKVTSEEELLKQTKQKQASKMMNTTRRKYVGYKLNFIFT